MKRKKTEKLSTWLCLPIVIGFSGDESWWLSVGGVRRGTNGSCDKIWFHYDFFLFSRNYEFHGIKWKKGRKCDC